MKEMIAVLLSTVMLLTGLALELSAAEDPAGDRSGYEIRPWWRHDIRTAQRYPVAAT